MDYKKQNIILIKAGIIIGIIIFMASKVIIARGI